MSIGLRIFLSSAVFALVIFYAITKNRWRWARALLALIVLTGVVMGGLYFWKQLPPTISPQTEYAGIRLGMGPGEVLSINGSPSAVYEEAEKEGKWRGFQPIIETKNLEKGRSYKTTACGAMSKVRIT
jgi:predicted membrane-bound mannosyltransferase